MQLVQVWRVQPYAISFDKLDDNAHLCQWAFDYNKNSITLAVVSISPMRGRIYFRLFS